MDILTQIDLENFRKQTPMDYIKAINLINNYSNKIEIFKEIYKITRLYIPDSIYKYYSLTSDESLNQIKLDTLLDKKVYLAQSNSLNDPFEGKAIYYKNEVLMKYERLKQHNGRLIDDFSEYTRISSFSSAGINSMPMWAHYANNHAGYCVEYNTNNKENFNLRSSLFPIQYIDERLDITPIMEKSMDEIIKRIELAQINKLKTVILQDLTLPLIMPFFSCIKQGKWKYEEEVRCVTAYNSSYIEAMPITIYIGKSCNEFNKEKLINIAKKLDVKVYQMDFNEYVNNYELVPHEIDKN